VERTIQAIDILGPVLTGIKEYKIRRCFANL